MRFLPFLLVASLLLGACSTQRIKFASPAGSEIVLIKKHITIQVPSVEVLKAGKHPVEFHVSDEHARRLGFDRSFELYGYLEVGRATENSRLTNVVVEIPDDLIKAARTEGKVLETIVVDEGAGTVLVSLKLGEYNPF